MLPDKAGSRSPHGIHIQRFRVDIHIPAVKHAGQVTVPDTVTVGLAFSIEPGMEPFRYFLTGVYADVLRQIPAKLRQNTLAAHCAAAVKIGHLAQSMGAGVSPAAAGNFPADIRLRLPHLEKKRMIVFYDTPGPNTSKYSEHRGETYFALENLPLTNIFLVLDMMQLHTKDEEALLQDMGRVMRERGGMPLLVILNKCDCLDVEKESLTEIIKEVKDTVSQHVPENTPIDVIPVMAKGTEVWRRMIDRDPLTVFELEFAQYIDWRICDAMLEAAIVPEEVRSGMAEKRVEWRKLQNFSSAFKQPNLLHYQNKYHKL